DRNRAKAARAAAGWVPAANLSMSSSPSKSAVVGYCSRTEASLYDEVPLIAPHPGSQRSDAPMIRSQARSSILPQDAQVDASVVGAVAGDAVRADTTHAGTALGVQAAEQLLVL